MKITRSEKAHHVEIIQLDTATRSGNVYPREEMEKAISQLSKSALQGTLGNPDGSMAIPLERVAFTVSDLRIEENFVVGTARVLNTPAGAALRKIITEAPASIAFRPVGSCEVFFSEDGFQVLSDYRFNSISALPAKDV